MRGFLLAFIAIQSAEAGEGSKNTIATTEFVKAMKTASAQDPTLRAELLANSEKRKQMLNRKLLNAAVRAPESGVDQQEEEFPRVRVLEDNYGDAASGLSQFNASAYSVKYTGCSRLAGYSDDLAQYAYDEVLTWKNFASFRLCPSSTCSDSSSQGCSYNYGEYLVPMTDYLQAVSQYQQDDLTSYCSYCEQCMYFENYFYGNRALDEDNNSGQTHACKHYDSCVNYKDGCTASDDDAVKYKYQTGYDQLFECQKYVSAEDNNAYYVGPSCSSDHSSISIGVFSDKFCTKSVDMDVSTLTGIEIDSDEVADLSNGVCISCSTSNNPYRVNDYDDNGISDVCDSLYEASAKCDYRIFEDISVAVAYQSTNSYKDPHLDPEAKTCSYIEKAAKGQHDKYGVIHIDGENPWIYVHDTGFVGRANRVAYNLNKASTGQIWALSLLIMGCVGLSIAAIAMHLQNEEKGGRSLIGRSLATPSQRSRMTREELLAAKRGDSILITRSSGSETWA